MYGEITQLQLNLTETATHIDRALDRGDRRAFRVWCKRRAELLVKVERSLLAMATTPQSTR